MQNLIELQIILGFNCNFSCGHCLNSSGPNKFNFDISHTEIENLAHLINTDSRIEIVSFNGGEPLKYIDQILTLRRLVTRNLKWSLTTNGSLANILSKHISNLELDSIVVSYDKFHKQFIKDDTFISCVQELKKVAKNIAINFVYEEIEEITHLNEIASSLEVSIIPTKLIPSGRSKHLNITDDSTSDVKCPNINNLSIKITYLPKMGFTHCCGPLLFDYKLVDKNFFSKDIDAVFLSRYYTAFKDGSAEQSLIKFANRQSNAGNCIKCLNYFKLQDVIDISEKNIASIDRQFIHTANRLDRSTETSLNNLFHVQYFIRINEIISTHYENNNHTHLQVSSTEKPSNHEINDFINFTIKTFYDEYPQFYGQKEISLFKEIASTYFNGETHTKFIRKNGEIVGTISLYKYLEHPFIKRSAYHIGYWGLDKSRISKNESEFIKSEWAKSINEVALKMQIPVVALIDHFNEGALNLAKNLGFKIEGMRLDKRL